MKNENRNSLFSFFVFISFGLSIFYSPMLRAEEASWQSGYKVYQPQVNNYTVFEGQNHDAAIVYFGGKWLAMWDSGTEAFGQVIWESTSDDLIHWSTPVESFSSSQQSENPVAVTATSKFWQPGLLVVGNELWCLWSTSGQGTYFSKRSPGGKWNNRLLLFNQNTIHYYIDNAAWSLFVGNSGIQTSDGKIMFPITLSKSGSGVDFWTVKKRDSVLYSADNGQTWNVSPGVAFGEDETQSWEATIWEPEPNVLNLIARNNRKELPLNPMENLKFTQTSLTNIDAWAPETLIPMEFAMSRPFAKRWGNRNLLVQNDSHIAQLTGTDSNTMLVNRKNLTLFFNRGKGYDFVAGLNFAPSADLLTRFPLVDYPQMAFSGDTGAVIHTEKVAESDTTWKTMVAKIDPLPSSSTHYLFPRQARGTVESVRVDNRNAMRLKNNYSSAGIDLDAMGDSNDKVVLAFQFKPETTHRQNIVTYGFPAVAFFAENGRAKLGTAQSTSLTDCGPIEGWTSVKFESGLGKTSVEINDSGTPACFVNESPVEMRTAYFGLNQYTGAAATDGAAFLVDVNSVKTGIFQEQVPPIVNFSTGTISYASLYAPKSVEISVTASGQPQIAKVEFYLDGNLFSTSFGAGPAHQTSWSVTSANNGPHVWTAKAFDTAGNTATTPPLAIEVKTDHSSFVGQSVPVQVVSGGVFPVTVTMKNEGTSPWVSSENYRLGSQNPTDNLVWGLKRVPLTPEETILPGSEKTFSFLAQAPALPGTYKFQWRMVHDAARLWFGASTPAIDIIVVQDTTPPTVTLATPLPNATIFGPRTVEITAAASDDAAVSKVDFLLNGGLVGSSSGPNFTFNWPISQLEVGDHTWEAVAYDTSGHSTKTTPRTVHIEFDGASFVRQSIPTSAGPGSTFPVSITLKNEGLVPWTPAERYRLGARNPTDNTTWGLARVDLSPVESIPPGAEKTFTFNAEAPNTFGIYKFQWQMVHDDARLWFGSATPNIDIVVDGLPPAVALTTPTANATFYAPQNIEISASATDDTGISKVEFLLDGVLYSSSTGPVYNVNWPVTSTHAGNHVWEALAYDLVGKVSRSVPLPVRIEYDNSSFVRQSVPTVVAAGSQIPVSVTLKNEGTAPWTLTEKYRLGSRNPTDNTTWGLARVSLSAGDSIPPGAEKTFAFTAQAPTSSGTYHFQWRMVHDGARLWFGASTPNIDIVVDGTPPTVPQSLAADTSIDGIDLSWSASTDAGGSGLRGYGVDVSTDPGFNSYVSGWQNRDVGIVVSTRAAGLTPSTDYFVRVRAYDGAGNASAPTPTVTATTARLSPAIPSGSVSTVSARSISVRWDSSANATYYTLAGSLSNNPGAGFSVQRESAGNDDTLSGLSPNTTYFIFLNACDNFQCTDYAFMGSIVTHASVPEVARIDVVDNRSIRLAIAPKGNPPGTIYRTEIKRSGEEFRLVSSGDTLAPTVTGLNPGSEYILRVSAMNHEGIVSMPSSETKVSLTEENIHSVRVYPNPYRPQQGADGIRFSQLPENTAISIYTMNGLHVSTIHTDSTGNALWPLTNEQGGRIASGIYLALVKKDGATKVIKLMVQR
jgi:hypothetical protein